VANSVTITAIAASSIGTLPIFFPPHTSPGTLYRRPFFHVNVAVYHSRMRY
jgi:hypothetical protein